MARRPLPSLNSLRAFEAFARTRSMTRAAEELGVTPGAVSRHVRGLEVETGAALVRGPRHDLVLTPAGIALAQALTPALDAIARALPGVERGDVLNVSCLSALAVKWLIPRLPAFYASHPGVRVQVLEGWGPVEFGDGVLHAAIRAERPPASSGQRVTPLMPNFSGPVLSRAAFAACDHLRERVLRLPRLQSETFMPAWRVWASLAGVALPDASDERTFEHNVYMLEAAAAGMGVAVTTWAFAAPDIASGRLVAPWGFAPLGEPFVFLRPRGSNAAADAFCGWLVAEGGSTPRPPPAK